MHQNACYASHVTRHTSHVTRHTPRTTPVHLNLAPPPLPALFLSSFSFMSLSCSSLNHHHHHHHKHHNHNHQHHHHHHHHHYHNTCSFLRAMAAAIPTLGSTLTAWNMDATCLEVARHTSQQVTRHTSCNTSHTLHFMQHKSQVTRHTSHVTCHPRVQLHLHSALWAATHSNRADRSRTCTPRGLNKKSVLFFGAARRVFERIVT